MPDNIQDLFFSPEPKPPVEIIIDRSRLQAHRDCPLYCKLDMMTEKSLKQPVQGDADASYWTHEEFCFLTDLGLDPEKIVALATDHDANRMRDVGIAFHDVMAQYIAELLAMDVMDDTDALEDLALAADSRFQPDLLHCAKLTGPKFKLWATSYISHEKQYSYRLPRYGPNREDVLLTTKPDLVLYGGTAQELECPDWKSGWGMAGHEFQAAFVSTVLWRSMEDVHQVTWKPFGARKGQWGTFYQYRSESERPWQMTLGDAEAMILSHVRDYVTETEWLPTPGEKRCGWCPFRSACPAPRSCPEIEQDRVAYAEATTVLESALKARKAVLKADYEAHGPIQTKDGAWYLKVTSDRPTFRLRKGTPEYLGEAEAIPDTGAEE